MATTAAGRLAVNATNSMPGPVPGLRLYCLSTGLFQCSCTPRLGRYGAGAIASLSCDKGFTRAEDRERSCLYVPMVVMPKRGKKNTAETERESEKKFVALRKRHNAVESEINSLEHHGLNRCLDVGLESYLRYVGFGVLSYNLHVIGRELLARTRMRSETVRAAAESCRNEKWGGLRWGAVSSVAEIFERWSVAPPKIKLRMARPPPGPPCAAFQNTSFRPDTKDGKKMPVEVSHLPVVTLERQIIIPLRGPGQKQGQLHLRHGTDLPLAPTPG